jgi:hypothetical protein
MTPFMQRIPLGLQRTFHEPAPGNEPLGEDWAADLRSIYQVRQAVATSIRRAQSNIDPGVAEFRRTLAIA